MEIDKIILKLSKLKHFEHGEGCSEAEVHSLENELGVKFPEDYSYFLQHYGSAMWFGSSILGLCDEDYEEYLSTLLYTKRDRETDFPDDFAIRPENTIVVGPYGGGGHFFLHCLGSVNEGKVVLLTDETCGKPSGLEWLSFTEFVKHYTKRA